MSSEEASRWEEENWEEEEFDPSLEEMDPSDVDWGEDDPWEEEETDPTEDTEGTTSSGQEPTDPSVKPTQPATSATTKPTSAPVKIDYIGDESYIINILLVGEDRRPGQSRGRSDSMILCSFNTKTKEISMVSFMRDLYVKIPGKSSNRINASYAYGGVNLLNKTLKQNFYIYVDGNVVVDFEDFKEIINMIGGVDIKLTKKEADHLNKGRSLYKEGMNHMTGGMALAYARIRKIDSDFQRTNRQRVVLNAILEKVKDMNLADVLSLASKLMSKVRTDMSDKEILGYVKDIFPMLSGAKVNSVRIPQSGAYENKRISGMAVLVPNLSKARATLKSTLK